MNNGSTKVHKKAFAGCVGLQALTISKQLLEIGEQAFYGCGQLKSIVFEEPSNIHTIEYEAFAFNLNLSTIVNSPSSLVKIGDSAFYGSEKLEHFPFESLPVLRNIGHNAFYRAGLKGPLNFQAGLAKIDGQAFYLTRNTTSVSFAACQGAKGAEKTLQYIGKCAFCNSGIHSQTVFLPRGVRFFTGKPKEATFNNTVSLKACTMDMNDASTSPTAEPIEHQETHNEL